MTDNAGLFAVIGAAVGAVGTQVTGIIQVVSKRGARRAKAAAAMAAAKEVKRRPLYESLIGDINRTAVLFMKLRLTIEPGPPDILVLAQYGEAFKDAANRIYASATKVRIDGSGRASDGAGELLQQLRSYAEELSPEERLATEQISTMISKLKHAEEELIQAARDDFGS